MKTVLQDVKRIWPKASWSISCYDKNRHVGYVSNGELIGSKKFVSGWAEAQNPEAALVAALSAALAKEYERDSGA